MFLETLCSTEYDDVGPRVTVTNVGDVTQRVVALNPFIYRVIYLSEYVCNLETFGKHEMKIDTTNLRVNFAIE